MAKVTKLKKSVSTESKKQIWREKNSREIERLLNYGFDINFMANGTIEITDARFPLKYRYNRFDDPKDFSETMLPLFKLLDARAVCISHYGKDIHLNEFVVSKGQMSATKLNVQIVSNGSSFFEKLPPNIIHDWEMLYRYYFIGSNQLTLLRYVMESNLEPLESEYYRIAIDESRVQMIIKFDQIENQSQYLTVHTRIVILGTNLILEPQYSLFNFEWVKFKVFFDITKEIFDIYKNVYDCDNTMALKGVMKQLNESSVQLNDFVELPNGIE